MAKTFLVVVVLLVGCGTNSSIPASAQQLPRTEEEAQRIAQEIRHELGEDFLVEQVEDCFFVATNDTPVTLHASKAVISTVLTCLYRDYFTKKPEMPVRVFLFKDKATYDEYCLATYKKRPMTPFGFYVPRERKIVLNISMGTGTLAHVLIYPLLEADFPMAPGWLNVGFASLFEQSDQRDGKFVGFINWRLPGLQKAIRADRALSLAEIMNLSTDQACVDEPSPYYPGMSYAAARYLCLYIQETSELNRFYRDLKANIKDDRTGIATLEKVTGKPLDALNKSWREWVLSLRYRG
jgi:hypothetical protein